MIVRLHKLFERVSEVVLEVFQRLVQRPVFFFLNLFICLTWIAIMPILPHPLDDWRAGYPVLVFIVSIFDNFIEAAIKVQQAIQSAQNQAQMDRQEKMLSEQLRLSAETFRIGELILNLSEQTYRSGLAIQKLVETLDAAFDSALADHTLERSH